MSAAVDEVPIGTPPDAAVPDPLRAALDRARTWLQSCRNTDGSWGYGPDEPGRFEPTVLAAAAGSGLGPDAQDAWLARRWMDALRFDGTDGTWPAFLVPAVAWHWDPRFCVGFVDHILDFQSQRVEADVGFDTTIPGWSWRPGTAAWVEPTSYAMLSLARAEAAAPERRAHGTALLRDRQCDDGGWNYGNPTILGARLPGHLAPTSWAVMALPAGPAVDRGLAYLTTATSHPSTLGLAGAVLAHRAHGRSGATWAGPLAARITDQGVRQRVDLTAMAAAALAAELGERHAFV